MKTIGDLPQQQRTEVIRQLAVKMVERADIGAQVNEHPDCTIICIPKAVKVIG